MEVWRRIVGFPGYSVSSHGRVRNDDNGRLMVLQRNQTGVVNVGLTKRLTQYKRSVALLVASAFLPPHHEEAFDTPINLNGDRFDNRVDNLVWRPRWFAVRYFQQFNQARNGFHTPIEDTKSGQRYENSWEAAITHGLLDRDIYVATLNRTYVFPTFQVFRVLPVDADIR